MEAFPDPHPALTGDRVRVYEVGPRDGLQAEREGLPATTKIEFIHRLVDCGLTIVEATSFVSPRWVPQLADAAEVMSGLRVTDQVRLPVLVPNATGLQRALAAGAREVAVVVSSTESFAQANLATSLDGAMERAAAVITEATVRGVPVRGYVSMAFGDPEEGRVAVDRPAKIARRLIDAGCRSISLGDTIGVATAGHVLELLAATADAGVGVDRIALHFHDTYGQALANVTAGLTAGVREFDASAGGLGGCPYARSATGNLATEDLLWLLHGLGLSTGVDLAALARTSAWMAEHLGRPAPSRVVTALTRRSRVDTT